MGVYRFDEKIYRVGDAFLLHRFTNASTNETKEETIYALLTEYTPTKLTFITTKGVVNVDADIDFDHSIWYPRDRYDSFGMRHRIINMGGLKVNTDIIENMFNIGNAYYLQTPYSWLNLPSFYGLYTGYNPKDLWEWPELKFMTVTGNEVKIDFADILRGDVEITELGETPTRVAFKVVMSSDYGGEGK